LELLQDDLISQKIVGPKFFLRENAVVLNAEFIHALFHRNYDNKMAKKKRKKEMIKGQKAESDSLINLLLENYFREIFVMSRFSSG